MARVEAGCTRREALGLAGALLAAAALTGTAARRARGDEAAAGDPAADGQDAGGDAGQDDAPLFAFPDRASGLWGFMDAGGAVVVEPAFSAVASEPGGTMGVCPTAPTGLGDGADAAEACMSAAIGIPGGVFWGDLMAVQDAGSGLWGYIDRTGAWAVEPAYAQACTFNEGMAVVQGEDGAYSYLRPDGSTAFTLAEATYATCFNGGLAFVHGNRADDRWGCIGTDGQWALDSAADPAAPYCYDRYIVFSEGLGGVGKRFVDTAGATALDFGDDFYSDLDISSDDVANACYREGKVLLGGWVWDQAGGAVGAPADAVVAGDEGSMAWLWESAGLDPGDDWFDGGHAPFDTGCFEGYSEGLCAVGSGYFDVAGYADGQGGWAMSPRFGTAKPLGGGFAFASEPSTGDYGVVDATGAWVASPRFTEAGCPAGGFAPSFYGGLGYAHVLLGSSGVDLAGWVDPTGGWVRCWPTYAVADPAAPATASEGLAADPYGRWSGAEVAFDEAAQTCSASAPIASPGWFETVSGEAVYAYAYRDGAWVPEWADESGVTATYENLVGTYELDGSQRDNGGGALTSLTVTSVDAEGNVAATFAWKSVADGTVERTATLTGTATPATAFDGTRRVAVALFGTTDGYGGEAACFFSAEHRVDGAYEDGVRSVTYRACVRANKPGADDPNYQGYSCGGTLTMPEARSATA